jgi:hypothetical protein
MPTPTPRSRAMGRSGYCSPCGRTEESCRTTAAMRACSIDGTSMTTTSTGDRLASPRSAGSAACKGVVSWEDCTASTGVTDQRRPFARRHPARRGPLAPSAIAAAPTTSLDHWGASSRIRYRVAWSPRTRGQHDVGVELDAAVVEEPGEPSQWFNRIVPGRGRRRLGGDHRLTVQSIRTHPSRNPRRRPPPPKHRSSSITGP